MRAFVVVAAWLAAFNVLAQDNGIVTRRAEPAQPYRWGEHRPPELGCVRVMYRPSKRRERYFVDRLG
ncbi:MAG TPA: hypothetical protein VFN64_13200 [Burkholderiaceae bacterium]|nr:hypothetical protein [Burkholderiaceae bacterium]